MRLFSFKDESWLLAQWQEMYSELCQRYRHYRLDIDAIYPAQLQHHKLTYIRLLAKGFAEHSYHPQTAYRREWYLGKWRFIYDLCLTDRFLHYLWTQLVNQALEQYLIPNCYAYRTGKSIFEALRQCARFVRLHKKNKRVDLYVLRSDIHNYADSIPLHGASPLWSGLKNVIENHTGETLSTYHWSLLVNLVRPQIDLGDGTIQQNIVGIPFGSPLCNPLYNFYLHPLDAYLSTIPGGYYGRYSDDFIFIHPDGDIFLQADQEIDRILKELSLTRNTKKESRYYLTVAGKACVEETFRGASQFDFLGLTITAHGTITLNKIKNRVLLRKIRSLLHVAQLSMRDYSLGEKTRQLCQLVNVHLIELSQKNVAVQNPFAKLANCTDRIFFKQLDRELALAVAESASGLRGNAAFAQISYHHIRHRFGLQSLSQLKNQGRREQ